MSGCFPVEELNTGTNNNSNAGSNNNSNIKTGVLVDSVVANIKYSTDTQSGFTNDKGEYSYIEGENVTFSIGDIQLPDSNARGMVTPYTIVNSTDTTDSAVINVARLLQSLDADADPNNGIKILNAAHTAAVGMSLDFNHSVSEFETAITSLNLLNYPNSPSTELVSIEDATAHLDQSLDQRYDREKFIGKTAYFIANYGRNEITQTPVYLTISGTFKTDGFIYIIDPETEEEIQGAGFNFINNDGLIENITYDTDENNNPITRTEYVVTVNYDVAYDLYTVCDISLGADIGIDGASLSFYDGASAVIASPENAVEACQFRYDSEGYSPSSFVLYTFSETTVTAVVNNGGPF